MKTKAVLIDGHNFLFRGFYGVPTQAKHADGTQINAVYGFFSLLKAVIKKVDPKYLIVVFDSETSSDSKKLIKPEYKANRLVQNNTIFDQLLLIKRCLDIIGIRWVEDESNEADDIVGTFSEKFSKKGVEVFICSNDHDFFQLVHGGVCVLRGFHGELTVHDHPFIFQKFGIKPEQYVDYLALTGDATDNIRGVKGIGKKRAADILSVHQSITQMYKSFNLLSTSLQKKLYGQENELLERKEFLKINNKLELENVFTFTKYTIQKSKIPEKMGEFLTIHWDRICIKQ